MLKVRARVLGDRNEGQMRTAHRTGGTIGDSAGLAPLEQCVELVIGRVGRNQNAVIRPGIVHDRREIRRRIVTRIAHSRREVERR